MNRPFNRIMVRLAIVAAVLATLMLLAPAASAATAKLTYEENGTDAVATLSATDEDGDAIDWTLAGDDASKFAISDDGVLTFKDSPNYEGPVDDNKNNVYLVTVNASEMSDPLDLEITVTDEDEPGKVSLTKPQPQVARDLVASLSDPDAGVEDEKWQWARGSSADGPWTDIDRATSASRSPVADDLDMYLRATVVYEDKFGTGKTESMVSENAVEERTTANAAPSFKGLDETGPDIDDDDDLDNGITDQIIVTRDVDEGLKSANVGKPIMATDANNDVLLYTIDTASKTNFTINSRSGQLKTKIKLNSDDDGLTGDADTDDPKETTYKVMVTATDPSGAPMTQDVTVTVTDVNDAPEFPPTALKALWVTEKLTVLRIGAADDAGESGVLGTGIYVATDADAHDAGADNIAAPTADPAVIALKYAVEGPDKSKFMVTADPTNSSIVTLAFDDHTPNYEKQKEYEITIVASDDSAPEGVGTVDVTVNVTNAEDDGLVTPSQREPQIGKEVVVSLSDEDGNVRGQSWQWYRNAAAAASEDDLTDSGVEACEAADTSLCSITGATSPNYTPVAADVPAAGSDLRLAARVTYTDGHLRPDADASPATTDTMDMMHVVMQAAAEREDPANTAPKFSDDQDPNTPGKQADAARSVPENAKDANVGDPVTATDSGDKLIYSLSGADAASFTIVSGLKGTGAGEGQIKTAVKLDYETKDSYMVMVTATDPSGATDSVMVNISVTDVDDKTVVTVVDMTTGKLSYAENGTDAVATLSATDEDGDAIDWTLAGDDASKFAISDDGVLTFKDSPNYEGPVDDNKNNVYLVTVNASETSDPLDLEITVTDEDEPGKVSLTKPQPQVARDLVASLSDPDAGVEDEKWQWARGSSADGPWTDIDRATSASRSPVADDLDMYLRATVVYEDKFGTGKTESMVSENAVEERTTANAAPSFKGLDETGPDIDDDDNLDNGITDQIIVTRDVDEGLKSANVGKPIMATDANNDVLLYTIDTASKTNFTINSRSGQLKTKIKLNSDDDGLTGDADTDDPKETTYKVMVTATDPSGAPMTQDVTVTVTDVNDAPEFPPTALKALWVTEKLTVLRIGAADDAGESGVLGTGIYVATDADAHDAGADNIAAPTADPAVIALKYAVEGPDKSKFMVTADPTNSSIVTLAFDDHTPNYEKQKEYEITIVASDDSAPEGVGTVDVTVNVTNAEDDGLVTPSQREPQIGKEVVVSLSDEDGNVRGQSWQWYRNAAAAASEDDLTDSGVEACEAADTSLCSITGATSPNYTPVAADVPAAGSDLRLAARVTYTDGHLRPDADASPATTDTMDMMHVVMQAAAEREDPANTAPKFSDDQDPNTPGKQADAARSVPENAKDANVGDPVTATDSGDKLIYSLSGADAASFTIVSGLKGTGAGEGQIKTAVKLDYETKDSYMVMVTATDPSGATDSVMVNISVTDEDDKAVVTLALGAAVNTAPAFDGDTTSRMVNENMPTGTNVGEPVMATDEDDDTLTYSINGPTSFTIDPATGQITTTMALDYEMAMSHTVTVTATDTEDTDSIDVTITVGNVVECEDAGATAADSTNAGQMADCEALLASRDALMGADATRMLNWSVDTPIADWHGVRKLSESGRVEWLYLHGVSAKDATGDAPARAEVKLNGTIPAELGGLTELTRLYLHRNNLTGGIPAELNGLTNLVWLRLYDNMLTGEVPDLSDMTSLERLYIQQNQLTGGVPTGLSDSVTHIQAHRNELSGPIPDLSGMTNLVWLGLYKNDLSGAIPATLGMLSNLETLYLHGNMLTGVVPTEIGDLTALTNLWLKNNMLTGGLPSSLDNLMNLERVRISGNAFEGCIPAALAAAEGRTSDADMLGLATCGDAS